ncbi:hypothetical protein BAW75_31235 [Micromonospora chalcea]|nr:hypothetical protein BAW75_31235 [Micromonospora chalcea]
MRVDAEHVTVVERAIPGMPVLNRAIAPRVVDYTDRREIENRCRTIGLDPHLMGEHAAQELVLALRCHRVAVATASGLLHERRECQAVGVGAILLVLQRHLDSALGVAWV